MSDEQIKIMADPLNESSCRFTVDRPVYPDASYYFGDKQAAEQSPLAKRLFEISGVASVLVSHDQITVRKATHDDWLSVGRQVGPAIRQHISSGQPAVSPSLRATLPPEDEIRERVQNVFDSEVNPAIAGHGGIVRLIDVKENNVFL